MKLFIIKWPNGEKELIFASSYEEVFFILDQEGNPFAATIKEIDLRSAPPLKIVGNTVYALGEDIKTRKIDLATLSYPYQDAGVKNVH